MTPEKVSSMKTHSRVRADKQQQAHATLVALRELHDIGHPIKSKGQTRIRSGILGLEALHNLTCWELMTAEYGYSVPTVHQWYGDATKNGSAWFVRWTTDFILKLELSGKVTDIEWTQRVQGAMFNIMRELQHATTEIDVRIKTKAQKQA
jgi:hypothetical protein